MMMLMEMVLLMTMCARMLRAMTMTMPIGCE